MKTRDLKTQLAAFDRSVSAGGNALILLLSLLLSLCLAGCWGSWSRPEREAGSALWVEPGELPLEPARLKRFESLGVAEVFVPFGRLEPGAAGTRLSRRELPRLPSHTAVTLAVTGEWRARPGNDDAGEALAEDVRSALIEAEGLGWTVQGVHFDVAAVDDLGAYGEALKILRNALGAEHLLSASVERPWLESEEMEPLIEAVDFLVPFLYGERVDRPGDAELWSLDGVDEAIQRLETLGREYLVGVVTTAALTLHDEAGRRIIGTTEGNLTELALHPVLHLEAGFSFEGCDCRRYNFEARSATTFHDWEMKKGESIRVSTLTRFDVERYREGLARRAPKLYLGDLFYRRPHPDEALSLGLEGLQRALVGKGESEEAPGQLAFTVEAEPTGRRPTTLRFRLENPGPESTELAFLDANYLDIELSGGTFAAVDPGDFSRYQLLRRVGDELVQDFRRATVLRLYRPVLEAGHAAATGDVRIRRSSGTTSLRAESRFLLPNGETLGLVEDRWPPRGH